MRDTVPDFIDACSRSPSPIGPISQQQPNLMPARSQQAKAHDYTAATLISRKIEGSRLVRLMGAWSPHGGSAEHLYETSCDDDRVNRVLISWDMIFRTDKG